MFDIFKRKAVDKSAEPTTSETVEPTTISGEQPVITKEKVLEILHPIKDPDLNVSIVDLGLIRDVEIVGAKVKVKMILTSPGCPYGPMLLTMTQRMLELEEYLDEPEVELITDEYLQLSDLSDTQRLALGLDF